MRPNNTIIQSLWNLYTRAVSVDTRNEGRNRAVLAAALSVASTDTAIDGEAAEQSGRIPD
jgi:hypothetical protein